MKWGWTPFLVVFMSVVQPGICFSGDDLPSPEAVAHEMPQRLGLADSRLAQPSARGIPQASRAAATVCDECPPDPKVTALCIASEGDLQEVQRLLKEIRTPNVTSAGTSPLCIAANHAHPEIVQALLAAKADPNYRPLIADGFYGSPPLLCAASCDPSEPFQSSQSVVKILLAAGADINQGDSDGYTPLMGASASGNLEMVNLLIKNGASLNAATRSKQTALYYARKNGHLHIVRALSDLGAAE